MEKFLSIPFEWKAGSLNDNGIKLLKDRKIRWCYSKYFELYAKQAGRWLQVTYKKLTKEPNDDRWILQLVEPKYPQFSPSETY